MIKVWFHGGSEGMPHLFHSQKFRSKSSVIVENGFFGRGYALSFATKAQRHKGLKGIQHGAWQQGTRYTFFSFL